MRWCKSALAGLVLLDLVTLLVIVASPAWPQLQSISLRPWVPFAISIGLAILASLGLVVSGARQGPSEKANRGSSRALLSAVTYAFGGLGFAFFIAGAVPGYPVKASGASVTLLAVNDIYRIEGVNSGTVGGLARLRTLRAKLEAEQPGRVLLLHAGDVIFPSLLSRMYKGQQMIDVLNLMDGDSTAGRLDERMFVVFGNHEFEKESCDPKKEPVLQKRVAESDFYWLHSNLALTPCKDVPNDRLRLLGANLLQAKIVQAGGMRIGLFGLTIDSAHPSFKFLDPVETAAALTADLRRLGANVVIALTH